MFNRVVERATLGLLCLVSLVILIWPLSGPAQGQPQVDVTGKNVLILHSLEGSAPVFVDTDKALITRLESGGIPRVNQFPFSKVYGSEGDTPMFINMKSLIIQ